MRLKINLNTRYHSSGQAPNAHFQDKFNWMKSMFPVRRSGTQRRIKGIVLCVLLFLSSSLLGCTTYKGEDVKAVNKVDGSYIATLAEDSLIVTYNNLYTQLVLGISADRYGLDDVKQEIIDKNIRKCKTNKDISLLYEKAGMKNAKEYVDLKNKMFVTFTELNLKYPDLLQLPDVKRMKILKKVFSRDLNIQYITDSLHARLIGEATNQPS